MYTTCDSDKEYNTVQIVYEITAVKTATRLKSLCTNPSSEVNGHWSRFSSFACDTLSSQLWYKHLLALQACKAYERGHEQCLLSI